MSCGGWDSEAGWAGERTGPSEGEAQQAGGGIGS